MLALDVTTLTSPLLCLTLLTPTVALFCCCLVIVSIYWAQVFIFGISFLKYIFRADRLRKVVEMFNKFIVKILFKSFRYYLIIKIFLIRHLLNCQGCLWASSGQWNLDYLESTSHQACLIDSCQKQKTLKYSQILISSREIFSRYVFCRLKLNE